MCGGGMLLHIALQEGFTKDTVLIRCDGQEIYRKAGVSTRTQTGYADSVELDMHANSLKVTIELPQKQLSKTIDIAISAPTYLGLSVTAGQITHRISREPFGYL
jgi:hypothetical protein